MRFFKDLKEDIIEFNGKVFKPNNIISTAKTLIDKEAVEINGKAINIKALAEKARANVKTKSKKSIKLIEKYSLYIAGEILVETGSTTVDDDLIATAISAAIVACATCISGSAGTVLANVLTSATVTPIVKGILYKLDAPEVELGKKAINKSNSL